MDNCFFVSNVNCLNFKKTLAHSTKVKISSGSLNAWSPSGLLAFIRRYLIKLTFKCFRWTECKINNGVQASAVVWSGSPTTCC